jgi:hypothetical protein
MDADEWPCPNKSLKHDKGEHRHKHSGTHEDAQVIYEKGAWVGKCPKGFSPGIAQDLLERGIPEFCKTVKEKPRRIWSYYEGAIYAARSSDGGITWHGYPTKEEPPRKILRELNTKAQDKDESARIKKWLGSK